MEYLQKCSNCLQEHIIYDINQRLKYCPNCNYRIANIAPRPRLQENETETSEKINKKEKSKPNEGLLAFADSLLNSIDDAVDDAISLPLVLELKEGKGVKGFCTEIYKKECPITLGREGDKNIEFFSEDTRVSRKQCTIDYEDNQWIIMDGCKEKSSSNGTWIKKGNDAAGFGTRCEWGDKVSLEKDDEIRFGSMKDSMRLVVKQV